MKLDVGILINEVVLRFSNRIAHLLKRDDVLGSVQVRLEIILFGRRYFSRFYTFRQSGGPILPWEKFQFHKEYPTCDSIVSLLIRLKKEAVVLRLWAEYNTVDSLSPSRIEIWADYEDTLFNFLYPYDTLKPCYDVIARNLRLHPTQVGGGEFLARLALSVSISQSEVVYSPPDRRRRESDPRKRSHSPSGDPSYMQQTFSSLIAEDITRKRFLSSPRTARVSFL